MAREEFRVELTADNDISKEAKKAKQDLDKIPDRVETTVDVEASGLDDISEKLGELPGMLGQLGPALGSAGLAGAAAGIGAGLFAAANAAADLAIDAKVTADLTGTTVEDASKLQAVWKTSGADINDLNDVLLQMNGVLQTSPELAKQLGINLNDGKDVAARFVEVVAKIESSTLGAAEKAQLMAQVFGEEGVRQVGALTTLVGSDLQAAMDGVAETQIMSEEDVDRAVKMKAALADAKAAATGIATELGQDLVPAVTAAAELATTVSDMREGAKGTPILGDIYKNIAPWESWRTRIDQVQWALDKLFGNDEITSSFHDFRTGTDEAAEATDEFAEAEETLKDQLEGVVDAVKAAIDAEQEMADARRAAADAQFGVRDAQRDFEEQVLKSTEALGVQGLTLGQMVAEMDATAQSAGKLADQQVQLATDTATAKGQTLSAKDAQRVWNASMITTARTTDGPMRDAIINYIAEVNGIEPEKVTKILANPDYASIDAAAGALDEAAEPRYADIVANAITGAAEGALNQLDDTRYMDLIVRGVTGGAAGAIAGLTSSGRAAPVGYAAPAPMAAPTVVHVNLNAAVIGDRYEVQRAVTRAIRGATRISGARLAGAEAASR